MKTNKITLIVMGLALASLVASCKKNDNNAAVGEGFRAFTEQGDNGNSRTHGVADGSTIQVQWTSGDQILVANQGGSGSTLTYNLKSGANSTEGSFANTNESNDFLQPDYVAIYPAANANGAANSISGTTATFNLPATQTYLANSFAEKSMPMVAYSSEQSLQFKNVLGGLCFPIVGAGYTITKIEVVSANTSEALWGTCTTTISATGADPTSTVSNSETNKNVITLDCGSGIALDATTATDFYVMVPAGTLESGFTVKAYEGNNVVYEKTTSSAPGANFIPRSVVRKVNSNLAITISVTTMSPTFITTNSAYTGATVNYQLHANGILYAQADLLSGAPADVVVLNGANVTQVTATPSTSYNMNLTGLTENKVYYVRAYAITENGNVIYGEVIPFATRKNYYTGSNSGRSTELFSVSSTKQVYFSMGNLQYSISGSHNVNTSPVSSVSGSWRLAEYQFEYVGNDTDGLVYANGMFPDASLNGAKYTNTGVGVSSYTGWIDLYDWATSGCNLRGTETNYYYQPNTTYVGHPEYFGPAGENTNLTGTYANGDWGVYNAISNAGNAPGQWRTPQASEWGYLINQRSASVINGVANARYANVQLVVRNNTTIGGVMVFPDVFTWPSYVDCYPTTINGGSWPNNSNGSKWTEAQWSLLEQAGAVFLPAAGFRYNKGVDPNGFTGGFNGRGNYWSTTRINSSQPYVMYFTSSAVEPMAPSSYGLYNDHSFPVRLVRDAN